MVHITDAMTPEEAAKRTEDYRRYQEAEAADRIERLQIAAFRSVYGEPLEECS